jgi:predicted metal-dependent hydrolase
MDSVEQDYDPLYLQGIAYFNACEFFEAHEVWEDLWKSYSGDLRLFYKGLIQAAVALHHFGNGNIRGARKVYRSSRGYLDQYRPVCLGLDVEKFIAEFDACFAEVAASQEEFPQIDITPELIPEITLDPPVELPAVDVEG